MQLNLTTDYALRCLLVLSQLGEGTSSKDVSEQIGIEREFTQKVLRKLRDAELVTSSKGKEGGYSLAKPLDQISLFEVMRITEDSMFINRCLEPDHFCSRMGSKNVSKCQVHHFYLNFQEKLNRILLHTSLQDVVDGTYELG